MLHKFVIHTDGGSRGNPGPAAIGVVISVEVSVEVKPQGRAKRFNLNPDSRNLRGPTSETRFDLGSSGWTKATPKGGEPRLASRREYGEYIGITTNNVAEYQAVIFALKKLKQLIGNDNAEKAEVVFYMDSELLMKQLNHEYKVKEENIQKLFLEVHNLRLDFGKVEFKHVLRGKNTAADKLVNQVLDRESNKLDL